MLETNHSHVPHRSENRRRNYPACFDSNEQFRSWQNVYKAAKPGQSQYCEDCTPEYKAKMLEQLRCGHTKVVFFQDADGFLAGSRPGTVRFRRGVKKVRK